MMSVDKPKLYLALIEEIQQHIDVEQAVNLKVNYSSKEVLTRISKRKLDAQSSGLSTCSGNKSKQYKDQEYVPRYQKFTP